MKVQFKCRSGQSYTITDNPDNKDLLVLNGGVFHDMDIEPLKTELKVGSVVPIKYADTERSRKHTDVFQYGACVLTTIDELTDLEK